MILRLLTVALVLIVGLPMGWRLLQSPQWRDWLNPPAPVKKAFQFDNGTVREPPAPASGPAIDVSPGLRKCRQGERVVYTDGPCPAGSKPVTLGGTVNVVPGTRPAEAAAPGPGASQPPGARRPPHVRDLMHDSGPTLNEQAMERAMQQTR